MGDGAEAGAASLIVVGCGGAVGAVGVAGAAGCVGGEVQGKFSEVTATEAAAAADSGMTPVSADSEVKVASAGEIAEATDGVAGPAAAAGPERADSSAVAAACLAR